MNLLDRITSITSLEVQPGWVPMPVREWLEPTLMLLMAVFGIAAIICVLFQKAQADGVGALSGETETYMGKNKGSRTEYRLKVATIVLMVLILVSSVTYFVIQM